MRIRHIALTAIALAVCAITGTQAYVLNSPKWGARQVPYYINPVNLDVSESAAEAAVQAGMAAWGSQSNANFSFYYMGRTSGSNLVNNGKNEIFFRNASNGSVIAVAYWWYSGSQLTDADIVFYDAGFTFFTGASGCSGGVYIEDVTTHEAGHALGLGHSAVGSATMSPSMGWCSTEPRTLDADDVAGVEALYPPNSTNTAPTVAITAPTNGSSDAAGTAVTFTGASSDREDGTLSSSIVWRSNIDGQFGVGASVAKALSAGSHTVTATTTDSAGASATSQVGITITSVDPPPTVIPPATGLSLSAQGQKVRGVQRVNLSWAGATSTNIDVYRSGALVMTTANDGGQTDVLNKKGGGTYTYQVCEAGTSVCSVSVTVAF
jgi:matrixin